MFMRGAVGPVFRSVAKGNFSRANLGQCIVSVSEQADKPEVNDEKGVYKEYSGEPQVANAYVIDLKIKSRGRFSRVWQIRDEGFEMQPVPHAILPSKRPQTNPPQSD